MSTEGICIISSLVVAGIIMMGHGMRTWFGKNRARYLITDYYVLLPKGVYYALPIIGLMTIVLAISLLMPKPELVRRVWVVGVFPLGIIAVLVIIFQPKWLKPRWIRWLEEYHSDILEILIREGRKTPDWAKRVSTQEGLEQWVAEVRRKHKL